MWKVFCKVGESVCVHMWWAYIYSHTIALIIDYWTIIINKSIVLINIHITGFIWVLTIIFGNFVFLG